MTDAANDPEDGAASDETSDEAAPQPEVADASVVEEPDEQSAESEQPADAPVDVSALIEAAQRERDTYLDHLRRERAEFENFRKRSTRERAEARDRGAEALVAQLLGVLDNFGYVLEAAKDADDAVAKGVRMIHDELRDVLTRAGLEDVPGVGSVFDPTWHDAVMQVEGDTADDGDPTVAQVLRTGYRFKGRVLRPASVAVTQ